MRSDKEKCEYEDAYAHEKERVDAVEYAAVTGDKMSGVLDGVAAFE